MSSDNCHKVGDILIAVGDALGPLVLEVYRAAYSDEDFVRQLTHKLRRDNVPVTVDVDSADAALAEIDLSGWLSAIIRNKDIFKREVSQRIFAVKPEFNEFISYIYELRRCRNKWAHPAPAKEFSDSDVSRISDTAARVIRAIKGTDHAEQGATQHGDEVASEPQQVDSSRPEEDRYTLEQVDVSHTTLAGLDLRGRNLRYANLSHTDLSGSNLHGENLSHASLVGANLSDVDMQHCDCDYANLQSATMTRANLAHARFYGANLVGAKLVNAHAPSTIFSGDLSRADLTDAVLTFVRIEEDSNLSYVVLKRADLEGARISYSEMPFADLTSAKMNGADIWTSNLTKAVLNKANLSHATIMLSMFKYADLSSANISYADIRHPELEGKDWLDFEDDDWHYHSGEFDNANLSDANIRGADAPLAIFRDANLTSADLTEANLQGARFRGADLIGAKFCDADLSAANLTNANLLDTDFLGANIEFANFTGAKFRFSTRLPDGSYWDEDTDMAKFTGPIEDC